jgi:hypothetical protein
MQKKLVLWVAVVALVPSLAMADTLINEFMPNPVGADPSPQDFELRGVPGDSFSGFLVTLDSDSTVAGTVNDSQAIAGSFDNVTGLLVVDITDVENPSNTFIITDSFTGSVGDDYDTNDDGVIDDFSAFGTVFDAIGIPDAVGDEAFLYGTDFGGSDMAFIGDEPRLVFRDSVTLDLYAVDDNGAPDDIYDAAGNVLNAAWFNIDPLNNTFGSVNPTIPEPASLMLLAVGGLLVSGRRR